MGHIAQAIRTTYTDSAYWIVACVAFLIVLGLNYYSLIYAVPGSSLAIFLETSAWWQVLLPLMLSGLIAILLGMQAYMLRRRFSNVAMAAAGTGTVSSFAGFVGSIFGSAGCLSCLTAVLGFLGTGTLLVLIKYRYAIIGVSILLLLGSIHMTAKSIACTSCGVRRR